MMRVCVCFVPSFRTPPPVLIVIVTPPSVALVVFLHRLEATPDLRDEQQPARLQRPVGLSHEVSYVGSHEGKAKDGDIEGVVVERDVGDVAGDDTVVAARH
jgi:hypothetical protein